jgi:hypothetical protein
MATVNKYFQSGIPMGTTGEQGLYESIIIESLKIYGFEVYYIPRSSYNEDRILGEDPLNRFDHAFPIEMYMENIYGYDGQGEFLSKFGVQTADSANFVVSRRRWTEITNNGQVTVLPRPAEGDLIFFPLTKSYFEIRKVEGAKPFYQVGKLYTYTLKCELYQYSNEVIDTGIDAVDVYPVTVDEDVMNHQLLLETGDAMLFEFFNTTSVIMEDFNIQNVTDTGSRNEDFTAQAADILDFTEKNPFGEILR